MLSCCSASNITCYINLLSAPWLPAFLSCLIGSLTADVNTESKRGRGLHWCHKMSGYTFNEKEKLYPAGVWAYQNLLSAPPSCWRCERVGRDVGSFTRLIPSHRYPTVETQRSRQIWRLFLRFFFAVKPVSLILQFHLQPGFVCRNCFGKDQAVWSRSVRCKTYMGVLSLQGWRGKWWCVNIFKAQHKL